VALSGRVVQEWHRTRATHGMSITTRKRTMRKRASGLRTISSPVLFVGGVLAAGTIFSMIHGRMRSLEVSLVTSGVRGLTDGELARIGLADTPVYPALEPELVGSAT